MTIISRINEMEAKLDLILGELGIAGAEAQTAPVARKLNREQIVEMVGAVETFSASELISIWQASPFKGMAPPDGEAFGKQSLIMHDEEYAAVTLEQAQRILDVTPVDEVVWKKDKTDCDNIANYMASLVAVKYGLNSIGVVSDLDEGHSYCAFLLHGENGVYLRGFEPQTDQWRDDVAPKSGWIRFG